MGESNQSESRNVQLYDIVVTSSQERSTNNMDDVRNDVRDEEEFRRISYEEMRRECSRNNNRVQSASSSTRRRELLIVAESTRNRVANVSCMLGILFSAIGGGLVLMFIVAEYSQSLQVMINYQSLVVPGFILLFIGIFSLVVGIYFCWVHKRRTPGLNDSDEIAAGFHEQHGQRNLGYSNHAMVPDNPPSYGDLEIGNNIQHPLPLIREPLTKLPTYKDAVKLSLQSKPEIETVDNAFFSDSAPPPYSNDHSTS